MVDTVQILSYTSLMIAQLQPDNVTSPFCGDIDMVIKSNGTWYYQGTPIHRPEIVRLFASVLRSTPEGFELVTPVERVGIQVEDAPFIAVTMQITGINQNQQLKFSTNIGDEVVINKACPLKFNRQPDNAFIPYCLVRDNLWAKLTRNLYIELVNIGTTHDEGIKSEFGVWSGGEFFSMINADELDY